jgi:hypothetical protein
MVDARPKYGQGSVRRDPVTAFMSDLFTWEPVMQTIEQQLTLLLRSYRTIRFCDACLALKLGAFPREVREAVVVMGDHQGFQVASGKCSECLQEQMVVRALAA